MNEQCNQWNDSLPGAFPLRPIQCRREQGHTGEHQCGDRSWSEALGVHLPPGGGRWQVRHVESGIVLACRDRAEAEAHVRESVSGPWVIEQVFPLIARGDGDQAQNRSFRPSGDASTPTKATTEEIR